MAKCEKCEKDTGLVCCSVQGQWLCEACAQPHRDAAHIEWMRNPNARGHEVCKPLLRRIAALEVELVRSLTLLEMVHDKNGLCEDGSDRDIIGVHLRDCVDVKGNLRLGFDEAVNLEAVKLIREWCEYHHALCKCGSCAFLKQHEGE